MFCDKKIDLDTRARLPIICDARGIVAVPLVAVADRVKPQKKCADGVISLEIYLS